jgi:hypothetical protein
LHLSPERLDRPVDAVAITQNDLAHMLSSDCVVKKRAATLPERSASSSCLAGRSQRPYLRPSPHPADLSHRPTAPLRPPSCRAGPRSAAGDLPKKTEHPIVAGSPVDARSMWDPKMDPDTLAKH